MNLIDGVADLHLHTTTSDGFCSVDDRIQQAQRMNLNAIAITDHDCISAKIEARMADYDGLSCITGVEVRADVWKTKVELLGYYVDPNDDGIKDILTEVREHRRNRNRKIIRHLRRLTNLKRSYEEISSDADGILGRPHIADVLIEVGIVDSIGSAFEEYLGSDGEAFVPMERVPAPRVIDAIQGAGGVVSLAHPGRIRTEEVEAIITNLVANGLNAIEVQYPYDEAPSEGYADISVEEASAIADEHDLLKTGGSDCHGSGSGKFRIGNVRVTEEQLNTLRQLARERREFSEAT